MKPGAGIAPSPPVAVLVAHQAFRRLLGRSIVQGGVLLFSCFLLVATLLTAQAQEALRKDLSAEFWRDLSAKVGTLYHQGRYSEATKVAKEALQVAEDTFGPDHPAVARSLNDVAELYRIQSKYTEAKPLFERSLAIYEKTLGPDDPALTPPLNNLALLYYAQGKYARAEPLYNRARAMLEKALGPDHPHVATTLENMAELCKETGKLDEAKELEARAQEIRSMNQ